MVRWIRWHCPPDTGFKIPAQPVWGRLRYLSGTEAPHNTESLRVSRKKAFLLWNLNARVGDDLRLYKQAALTTAPGAPPAWSVSAGHENSRWVRKLQVTEIYLDLCNLSWSKYHCFNINPQSSKILVYNPWRPKVFSFWKYYKCFS